MNTAFNLPPAKRDGELLDTATANKLIEAVNRLATIQVRTVRASGMVKSGLLVSKENAVLALAYRDAANVLGTAATIDLVTPYSGRRGTRVENGRNGSGGTVIIGDSGITTIPTTPSGSPSGTRKTVSSIYVKVGADIKVVGFLFIKTDGAWVVHFGTTCPATGMMLLPPLTENTGDWYANLTEAQTVIDDQTSNCVGYITSIVGTTVLSATDGGSSLTLDATRTFDVLESPILEMWASINLSAGNVLTVTQSISGTGGSGTAATATLYNESGVLVETISNITGANLVFSAAPYTGRYILYVSGAQESLPLSGSVAATFFATSSGTFSVCRIQALYDTGGASPSCLNCV